MIKIRKKIIATILLFAFLFSTQASAEMTYDPTIIEQINTKSKLNGQTLQADFLLKTVEDEEGNQKTINYFDDYRDIEVVDINGNIVKGTYFFSENLYKPIYGYNYVTYTFDPLDSRKYNSTTGYFFVKFVRDPNIRTYSNRINVNVNINSKIHYLLVNGVRYNKGKITNLKENTSYTIEIYQKSNKYLDVDMLLWSETVKTKSK
jgi:hypothetical protein